MAFLILLFLLAFSAFLSLSEFAVVSSRPMRLEHLAQTGNRGASLALRLLENPNRFLSTIQIGNTLCAIIAGAVGQAALTEHLAALFIRIGVAEAHAWEVSTVAVVIVITYFWLVFGELTPKRLGLHSPEPVSAVIATPMWLMSILTAPAVFVLSASIELVLKPFRLKARRSELASAEEIRGLIAQATRAGLFQEAERDLVDRIFRLGDQRVSSLMVPRADIVWLPADAPTDRIRLAVATSSHSHFPVCETPLKGGGGLDKIIGVVHLKDMIQAGLLTKQIGLRILARKPLFVPESMPALRLLDEFRRSHSHIAFIFDEYGVTTGLITLKDIVEGMLGQIVRHGEEDEALAVQREDGSWLLDGGLPIHDLKAIMNITRLPNDDRKNFQTLAGFILTYLGRIPRTGEHFKFDRFRFEVVDMDRHRIDKILLSFHVPPASNPVEDAKS